MELHEVWAVELLSLAMCRELLTSNSRGRVALTRRALPVVMPVRYGILEGDVVIRTRGSSWFCGAMTESVVALEVGNWEDGDQMAWSVCAQGRVAAITEPASIAAAESLSLTRWAVEADDDCFLRLNPAFLTGCRCGPRPALRLPPAVLQ